MSKFNIQLDENGNVSNIQFPRTDVEVGIEYPEPNEDGEVVKPSGVTMNGQSMSIEQFSEIKMEKDENGNITIGGSSSGNKPWWWDWFNKYNKEMKVNDNSGDSNS